jgi:ADP-ribose pyrophosphatase YjhB (NUDIX family)
MHIGRHIIQGLVLQFGPPTIERWSFTMEEEEFDLLKGQLSLGRAHDVTPLIVREDELAVVRGPHYPPNAFCAPSGAVHPEEPFLDGTKREALEKTGLEVEIKSYLLCVGVVFSHREEQVKWTTHVLEARPVSGRITTSNGAEAVAGRWIGWDELLNEVNPILRDSGRGELAYRARLHERAHELLVSPQPPNGA